MSVSRKKLSTMQRDAKALTLYKLKEEANKVYRGRNTRENMKWFECLCAELTDRRVPFELARTEMIFGEVVKEEA